MATLTYDPAEQQEGEFTPEEQENIKVGEALEEQQNQLLAGKFEDAKQLENAYIALQRKLGSPKEESSEESPEEPSEEPKETEPEEKEEDVDIDAADPLDEVSAMAPGNGGTENSGDVEISSAKFAKAIRRRKQVEETTSITFIPV